MSESCGTGSNKGPCCAGGAGCTCGDSCTCGDHCRCARCPGGSKKQAPMGEVGLMAAADVAAPAGAKGGCCSEGCKCGDKCTCGSDCSCPHCLGGANTQALPALHKAPVGPMGLMMPSAPLDPDATTSGEAHAKVA